MQVMHGGFIHDDYTYITLTIQGVGEGGGITLFFLISSADQKKKGNSGESCVDVLRSDWVLKGSRSDKNTTRQYVDEQGIEQGLPKQLCSGLMVIGGARHFQE